MDSLAPDYAGTLVGGRYRVEKLLGEGAMGSVWSGRHQTLGQLVAIKFIHPKVSRSEQAVRRFATEAKAATLIKSRHAVAVHDHGVTELGQPYIVMDYLEGESLESALQRRGTLPLPEVIEIVNQAALALQAAHDAGVIHRDLKPDNIFLALDSEAQGLGYTVKIVDFGIAKIVHEQVAQVATTQAGALLGTPFYMSPEALAGFAPVSPLSDVWALGACAFSALCGTIPFPGAALGDVVLRVCSAPLPVPTEHNPALPKAVDAWFARACARQPARRFQSAKALAEALRAVRRERMDQDVGDAYELRPREFGTLEANQELDAVPSSPKGRMLGGILVGVALTLGVLGYYVRERTLAADALARETADRALAIIEAENQRRREAAAAAGSGTSARPPPSASAAPAPAKSEVRPSRRTLRRSK